MSKIEELIIKLDIPEFLKQDLLKNIDKINEKVLIKILEKYNNSIFELSNSKKQENLNLNNFINKIQENLEKEDDLQKINEIL